MSFVINIKIPIEACSACGRKKSTVTLTKKTIDDHGTMIDFKPVISTCDECRENVDGLLKFPRTKIDIRPVIRKCDKCREKVEGKISNDGECGKRKKVSNA